MPKEITIFIGIWAILSLALVLTACVTDDEQEIETLERECTYYDYQDDRSVGSFDSVQIMLKKGYRLCE